MNKIIIYDFDGTLTPYPITNFKILEKCGYVGGGNNLYFKKIVYENMKQKNVSVYESFYDIIIDVVKSNGYGLTNDVLSMGSDNVLYNNGVKDFFNYLESHDVDNYLVSSSMKVFLDNVEISKYFKNIYATTFNYDNNGEVLNVKYLMTDEKKVDVIKSLVGNKDYKNVIYIGDGLTDLKAMEFVKNNGGISIYLKEDLTTVEEFDCVNYYFDKDYSLDSKLFNKIKEILDI